MQKIFFFSGVHGTGKTTIIHDLKKRYLPTATILDFDQFQLYPKDLLEGQIYRIANYYQTIKNTHASLILADRSPIDCLIYSETLHEYEKKTGFTKSHLNSVRNVFKMIPPDYYSNTYTVYFKLSLERTLKNIKQRQSESSQIMFNEDFINSLYHNFSNFYRQIEKIMNVVIFEDNEAESYSSESIVNELRKKCWLQPYEINELVNNGERDKCY